MKLMARFMGSITLALCLVVPAIAQEIEYFDGHPAVAGELLVKFRDGNGQKLRSDPVRMRRYQVQQALDLGRSGYTHLRLSLRVARRTLLEMALALAQDPDVEYVEPNYIVEATAIPNDPIFSQQWALQNIGQNGGVAKADIDATTAWETTKGSKANVIAVVDTGVDYTHPDLRDNIWSAPKEFTVTFSQTDKITCPVGSRGYNVVANTCDPKDVAQHGTMVSGVITASGNNAAGVSGVNWTGSVMALAFMDSTGRGSVSNAIRAIEFAIQAKKALGDGANIRVLNNSWGGSGFSQALLDQILKAQAAGMLFVAAAGNTPTDLDAQPQYPASYTSAPNLITVAATDNKDALATFSAFGLKTVHAGAPGVSIATTAPGGQYQLVSGTSFSSPITAGVAGLVLAACPALETAALRKVILDSTDPIPALAGKTITGGRINAYKAVRNCAAQQGTPGFKIAATPATVTLNPGGSVNVAVQVAAVGGFNGEVALTATGLPVGVTGVFAPAAAAPGTAVMLKLTAASTVVTADATVSIKGTSGTLNASTPVSVSVKQIIPKFTITVLPGSVSLNPGGSETVAVQIGASGGFAGAVVLSATGLPAGVSGVFSPATAVPSTAVTLRLTAATTAVPTTVDAAAAIQGVSGTLNASAPFVVSVKQAVRGFTIAAVPGSVTLNPGVAVSVAVQIAASGGFTGPVALTATGLPAGVSGVFTPASAAPGTPVNLKLTADPAAAVTPAAVTVTVTGVSGTLTANAPVIVSVKPTPSFNFTATPASVTVAKGATATFSFAVELIGSFNQTISLSLSGLPANATVSTAPAGPGKITLNITILASTTARSYALTATASAGTLRKVASVTLIVN